MAPKAVPPKGADLKNRGSASTSKSSSISSRQPLPTETSVANAFTKAALLLFLAGLSGAVSQLSLSPVYGSIPASNFHQSAVTSMVMLAFVCRHLLKRIPAIPVSQATPILAYWALPIQSVVIRYSTKLGSVYGALTTEAVTYLPLVFLSAYTSFGLLESLDLENLMGPTAAGLATAIPSYVVIAGAEKLAADSLPGYISTFEFVTRSGLQLLLATLYSTINISFWLVLAVPAMLHTVLLNPHYHGSATTALLNTTLQAHNYTLLERRESLTGYVSVLEDNNKGYRVMRCDHSLLGGNWILTPERVKNGQRMPETIYTVFTMLGAVRLVETTEEKDDSQVSALNIGLGIGTAPSAFIERGINTTIVEIDPAVHHFAIKYFDLPKNHTAVIQDAVTFVQDRAAFAPQSYDYVIHDVFTGGAEPVSLFTSDFLHGLRTVLKEDGVIAINYAGDLSLPSTQMVLNTIHHVFPVCRIFRDVESSETDDSDFVNMIVFCLNTHDRARELTFRLPTADDVGDSISRRYSLYPRPELEIKYVFAEGDDVKLLKIGETKELEKHQNEGAISHWRIMRTVIPDFVWELW